MKSSKRKVKSIFVGLFCLSICQMSWGASGHWAGIFPKLDLENGRRLELQAEYRNQGGSQQTLIRPFLSYPISESVRGGSGFDIFTDPEIETRIWQEFILSPPVVGLESFLRFRQEVRSRGGGGRVAFRSRFMGLLQKRIGGVGIAVFDELFVSESDFSAGATGLSRNWLGLRLNFPISKHELNLICMWEHVAKPIKDNGVIGIVSLGLNL